MIQSRGHGLAGLFSSLLQGLTVVFNLDLSDVSFQVGLDLKLNLDVIVFH